LKLRGWEKSLASNFSPHTSIMSGLLRAYIGRVGDPGSLILKGVFEVRVVLLKDVPSLGKTGDVVTVAEGYARNYLIPRRLAEPASEKRLQQIAHLRRQREKKAEVAVQRAEEKATILQEATVPVRVKVGEGNRLFGAVTAKDIALAIAKECGITLDKKQILLNRPLKEVGTYTVPVRLVPGVTASLKVAVTPE